MKTPFKLLDAFEYLDRDAYFGRNKEVTEQYSATFKTRLMLVYGLSGTGKTSLIQCGLANEFDGPDWYPIMMRPGDNIGESFREALAKRLPEGKYTGDPAEDIRAISRAKFRTVYLIIDQFEEFFTLDGNTREVQEAAMQSLRSILDSDINCRIMLVMREEYLGQLHPFEKIVPELFLHRFRVERMDDANVREVINQSFGRFNIHLEEPVALAVDKIVENSRGNNAQTDLPYLQVYLDMLYRDAFAEQYGSVSRADDEYPELHISLDQIHKVGKIEDVLSRFLDSRERTYYRFLRRKYDQSGGFPKDGIATVLDLMVTDEGTKIPIDYERIDDEIIPAFASDPRVKDMSRAALSELIYALSEDRIVRINPTSFELAHDSLAAIIGDRRTEEDKQLQFQYRRIRNLYDEFQASGKLLDRDQLISLKSFLPDLNLKPEVEAFIENSRNETKRVRELKEKEQREKVEALTAKAEALEVAELERSKALVAKEVAEREREKALQSKNEAESAQRKAKRWMWASILFILTAIILAGSLIYTRSFVKLQNDLEVSKAELLVSEENKDNAIDEKIKIIESLRKETKEVSEELTRVSDWRRSQGFPENGVVPWSLRTGRKIVDGVVLEQTDTFDVDDNIAFLLKIYSEIEGTFNIDIIDESGKKVPSAYSDVWVVPNPLGHPVTSTVNLNRPGKYAVRVSAYDGRIIWTSRRDSSILVIRDTDVISIGERGDSQFNIVQKNTFDKEEDIWMAARVVVDREQKVILLVRNTSNRRVEVRKEYKIAPNEQGFRIRDYVSSNLKSGRYQIQILDAEGVLLCEAPFSVTASKPN